MVSTFAPDARPLLTFSARGKTEDMAGPTEWHDLGLAYDSGLVGTSDTNRSDFTVGALGKE